MWELDCEESWAPKNSCFWTVVLERTLKSPLDCKDIQPVHPKGNQSWCSLEALMLKLKLQYFGHLMWRPDSFERHWYWERLRAGVEGEDRGWDCSMASPTQRTWVLVDSASWWWTGRPGVLRFMESQRVGHNWVTELNWFYREFRHDQDWMSKERNKTMGRFSTFLSTLFRNGTPFYIDMDVRIFLSLPAYRSSAIFFFLLFIFIYFF